MGSVSSSGSYRFVLLAKQHDGGQVELRNPGWIPVAALSDMADVARDEGYDLMYTLHKEMSLDRAAELMKSGNSSLVGHSDIEKLWVLRPETL